MSFQPLCVLAGQTQTLHAANQPIATLRSLPWETALVRLLLPLLLLNFMAVFYPFRGALAPPTEQELTVRHKKQEKIN